jgi:YD repeat-containing protein
MIVTPADWTDSYRYDERGTLLGWTRTRGDTTEEFTPDGLLVVKADDQGQPIETREVGYRREQLEANALPVLRAVKNSLPPGGG